MNELQLSVVAALTRLSNSLPAAARKPHAQDFSSVLAAVGLDSNNFSFLMEKRPLAFAPPEVNARTTASQERRYVFALFDHSGQEAGHGYEVYGERVGQGYASLDELAAQLKVTTQAIRVHLSNANKKNGWVSRPNDWWRGGGFLDFTLNDSRFEQVADMPPIDSPSLAEQVAKLKARPKTFNGRY